MDIEILSRRQIEKLLYHGGIDTDTAIISFCDEERKPVNLTLTKASSFKVIADDLDMDELLQNGGYDNFFSTAKAAARFVFLAVSRGKKIICQCEYGQSRSAGCAAAILEYFEGFGAKIFSDPRFYPSQAVYNKLYKALCVIGAQRDDELRLRRAIPDKEQIVSIIKDSIVQKYAESIYIISGDKKLHFFDVLTDDDRNLIQKEVDQLKEEINRVSESTEFNSQPLLDGFYDLKAYTNQTDVKVLTYSKAIPADTYTFNSISWAPNAAGDVEVSVVDGSGNATAYRGSKLDDVITITGDAGFEMKLQVQGGDTGTITNLNVECTGIGAMRLQVGSNEGQILEMQIPAINLSNMGLEGLDMTSEQSAKEGIERIKNALTFVNTVRGQLGAYQNRLENTDARLDITAENMTSAYSRIMDVDMAEEMTKYSTYTVMTQAGTSVLAQANDRPSTVLQLLQ